MIKYILVYYAGEKGDFLCNYINHNKLNFIEGSLNKSLAENLNLKNIYANQTKAISQDLTILPSHRLYHINPTLIQENNIKIVLLHREKKFHKTAEIESLIKNYSDPFQKHKFHIAEIGTQHKIKFKNIKNMEYFADFILTRENIDISNKNRYEFLLNKLDTLTDNDWIDKLSYPEDGPPYDLFLSYENLYIKKNYDKLKIIKPDFNPVLYEELLEKTWLPDIVNVFGYDLDLRKYGYRDY
jgi:hypothetical protein